jgi:hypothetical protein
VTELRTGWEPDTPEEDLLLRQALYNLTDFNAGVAEVLGARMRRTDDLTLADLGRPGGFMNNATFMRPADVDRFVALADEIDDFFAAEGTGTVDIWSAFSTPDFRRRGWELAGHPPLMFRSAGGKPPPAPSDLDIREVEDADEVRVFEDVLSTSFGNPGAPSILDERVLKVPGLRLWVGYVGDRPVCTSAVCLTRGVNGVQTVATLPEFRGRRFGEAMTWTATAADPSQPAILLASDLGRPVYERMGYVALLRFTYWKILR